MANQSKLEPQLSLYFHVSSFSRLPNYLFVIDIHNWLFLNSYYFATRKRAGSILACMLMLDIFQIAFDIARRRPSAWSSTCPSPKRDCRNTWSLMMRRNWRCWMTSGCLSTSRWTSWEMNTKDILPKSWVEMTKTASLWNRASSQLREYECCSDGATNVSTTGSAKVKRDADLCVDVSLTRIISACSISRLSARVKARFPDSQIESSRDCGARSEPARSERCST